MELISSKWDIAGIIGIPYSAKKDVVRQLESNFWVIVPRKLEDMDKVALHRLTKTGQSFVVDMGGYLARLATTSNLPIVGIVEETKQGHWRYEGVSNYLRYPVVSIAESKAKHIEHLAVGPAIVFSFEKILRDEMKDGLQGKNVLVLGYGSVGRAVANTLRGLGANVLVFDIDPARIIEAKLTGFRVGPKQELLEDADVIFGCSGRQSLNKQDFKHLRAGVYLVSGSSQQIEFDVLALETKGTKRKISSALNLYRLGKKDIVLVNEGFPVNFRDSSIPMSLADLVFAETLLALDAVASKPPGFHGAFTLSNENEVLEYWLQTYLNFKIKK